MPIFRCPTMCGALYPGHAAWWRPRGFNTVSSSLRHVEYRYGKGMFWGNPCPTPRRQRAARDFRKLGDARRRAAAEPLSDARRRHLVDPNGAAMGFPFFRSSEDVPAGLINPVLDYDFGPDSITLMDRRDHIVPPRIKRVIKNQSSRVDADATKWWRYRSCCTRLRSARISAGTSQPRVSHKGKICNYAGGMIRSQDQGRAACHQRSPPVAEERYATHEGYVAAVTAAARKAVAEGFLLENDASHSSQPRGERRVAVAIVCVRVLDSYQRARSAPLPTRARASAAPSASFWRGLGEGDNHWR